MTPSTPEAFILAGSSVPCHLDTSSTLTAAAGSGEGGSTGGGGSGSGSTVTAARLSRFSHRLLEAMPQLQRRWTASSSAPPSWPNVVRTVCS